MSVPVLKLKRGEDRRLRAGHLWIFSNEVDTAATPLTQFEPGAAVQVHSDRDQFLGFAYVNPRTLIAARIVGRDAAYPLDGGLLVHRLRVALALQKRGVPFRLRLLGDGPDRPRYEAWARERRLEGVTFVGWVPRTGMADYYRAAHFSLLPSRSEGWPKALSEAMAFGAVPVAAAVSSIPPILSATGAGVALPPEDTEGMAEAIVRFVGDPPAWRAARVMGQCR